jgi:hypothetical protein
VNSPSSDGCFARLKAAGWSMGEVGSVSGWLVVGFNGENVLGATAPSLAKAFGGSAISCRRLAGRSSRPGTP